jgi:tetratricopeptide (TPR) repeat protein/predicted Ser/Thr protein kinase
MHDDESTLSTIPDPPRQEPANVHGTAADVPHQVRKAQVMEGLFRKLEPVRIGRFTLLESIGSGSMGEIFAAYDEQLDRKVALKLVRAGARAATRADARLLREAQTLARLSHPNVVQVYEAGTYENRVFIAMEFIHGVTLSRWLETLADMPAGLRRREVLRIFIAAGRGLEAAHRAGLAHRDFKPDNALVGDDGRVRVVDFGLARAVGDGSESLGGPGGASADGARALASGADAQSTVTLGHDEQSARESGPRLEAAIKLTATGTILGTPRYMAPEQMRGQLADHRSDQFSFCVALYHALYGVFPFAGKSFFELTLALDSGEIVPPPRGVEVPAAIRQALLRGLARDPAARFPDMGALLDALEHGEPRARRRRVAAAGAALAAAGAVVLAVVGPGQASDPCAAVAGPIDTHWTMAARDRIRHAFTRTGLAYAAPTWERTAALLDDYAGRWRGEARDACEAAHVQHAQSSDLFDRRMLCLARGSQQLAALVHALGEAHAGTVEHAVEAATSLPDPGACRDTERVLLAPAPPAEPEIAVAVAAVRERLAGVHVQDRLGQYRAAEDAARVELDRARNLGYRPLVAEALLAVGRATARRADAEHVAAATAQLLDALDIAEATRQDGLAAEIWLDLVHVARRNHDTTAQAHAWSRRARAAVERAGNAPRQRGAIEQEIGELHYRDGRYADAERQQRAALDLFASGADLGVARARAQHALANTLHAAGQHEQADALYRQARSALQAALGAGHPHEARLLADHALALQEIGRLDEAHALLEAALGVWMAAYDENHLEVGRIQLALANVAQQRGHLAPALAHVRESLRIYERALGAGHAMLAEPYVVLGVIEFRRERYDDSRAAYQAALDVQIRNLGSDAPMVGVTRLNLAETWGRLGRHEDALAELDRAERTLAGSAYDVPAIMAVLWKGRGVALWGKRDGKGAVAALERALALFDQQSGQDLERAEALWTLAQAVTGQARRAPQRALDMAGEARRIFAASGEAGQRVTEAISAWLRQRGRPGAH